MFRANQVSLKNVARVKIAFFLSVKNYLLKLDEKVIIQGKCFTLCETAEMMISFENRLSQRPTESSLSWRDNWLFDYGNLQLL